MAIAYEFTCPNGHSFKAIAKLRARCPNCGISTRRSFSVTETKPSGPQTPLESSKTFSRKVAKQKTLEGGSTPVTDLKTEKLSKSVTKSSNVSETLPKKSLRIIRQGRTLPAKKVVEKKITPPAVKSPTRRVVAKRGTHPAVTRKPTGSRERKTVKRLEEAVGDIPFWQQVKRKYFR